MSTRILWMKESFYSELELCSLGLKSYGQDVKISRKVSFYAPEKIQIGNHVRIDDYCILSGNITLGNYIHIAVFCVLYGSDGIVVEDYSNISARTTIYTASDNYLGLGMIGPTIPEKYRLLDRGPVHLKRHTIIGSGSVVLPGVTFGEGVAVGALSLVTRDCGPWQVYGGIPARFITQRDRHVILRYQSELEKQEEAVV